MRTTQRHYHVTIQTDRADVFDRRINDVLSDPKLVSHHIEYRGDGFCACIEYTLETTTFDNVKEEYEARGDVYYCDECPYIEPVEDRRHKYHKCKCGTTSPQRKACLTFYQELARGELEVQR